MTELQEQLTALRKRMERIQQGGDAGSSSGAESVRESHFPELSRTSGGRRYVGLDEVSAIRESISDPEPGSENVPHAPLPFEEIETAFGKHYETETLYGRHKYHGSADIGALADMPADLLATLSSGAVASVPPSEWAFLDTETTGLAGGTGTCAFLVGVGRITPDGFRVRQFFMRDYGEEASSLDALTRHLEPFRVLITYNGRTFDQPLLETRYRMNRARPPFARFEHVDLLYGARRLWKLRFESCRLMDLENNILGVERHGDAPGALIPYLYFEYLRTQRLDRLISVFQHNATDILSLACLTAIVPLAFNDPSKAPLRHGAEMAALGRWLREAGELDQACALFRRAIETGLRDELVFRTLWDLAGLERKREQFPAALDIWNDLAAAKNPFQVTAHEELAKYYEHEVKDYARALKITRAALELEESDELWKREERLKRRVESAAPTSERAKLKRSKKKVEAAGK